MKKEILKNIGNMAEEAVRGVAGKALGNSRTSGDKTRNIADSVLGTVTGALGGKGGGGPVLTVLRASSWLRPKTAGLSKARSCRPCN